MANTHNRRYVVGLMLILLLCLPAIGGGILGAAFRFVPSSRPTSWASHGVPMETGLLIVGAPALLTAVILNLWMSRAAARAKAAAIGWAIIAAAVILWVLGWPSYESAETRMADVPAARTSSNRRAG